MVGPRRPGLGLRHQHRASRARHRPAGRLGARDPRGDRRGGQPRRLEPRWSHRPGGGSSAPGRRTPGGHLRHARGRRTQLHGGRGVVPSAGAGPRCRRDRAARRRLTDPGAAHGRLLPARRDRGLAGLHRPRLARRGARRGGLLPPRARHRSRRLARGRPQTEPLVVPGRGHPSSHPRELSMPPRSGSAGWRMADNRACRHDKPWSEGQFGSRTASSGGTSGEAPSDDACPFRPPTPTESDTI